MHSKHTPPLPPQYNTDHTWWWTGSQWVPANPPPPLAVGVILAALSLLTLALVAGVVIYAQVQGVTR